MQPDIPIAVVFTIAATAPLTWYLTRRFISRHYETAKALEFEKQRNKLINETKDAAIHSADFAARLDNEYRRGKDDGHKAELEKLTIVYEPYQVVTEEYLGMKKRAEIGYSMQLHYAGLPIGEPTRKVLHAKAEFDQAKIDNIMNNELIKGLGQMCQLLASKGMSGKVLPRKVA
jgi:flagellar biosynthesis/type III secretory pathway protein FliH